LNNQDGWIGPGEAGYYTDQATGQLIGPFPYDVTRDRTVTDSTLPSWATLNLNFSYDFSRSRLSFDRFRSLELYMNIENVGDRIPDFFSSNNGIGGLNTTYFSGMGRQYRMGVRMSF
jgi:outer membrane receptor protein involved in Fe transport